MEDNVVPLPEVAPSEDSLQHCIYLLKLDVSGPEAVGAPG